MADQDDKDEKTPIVGKKKVGYFLILFSIILICIGIVCVVFGAVEYQKEEVGPTTNERLGVVVDAGGSGTRLVVYGLKNNTFTQLKYIKCESKGLQKYSEDELPALKGDLIKCFNQAASTLPKNKKVPIYFGATAGMRLLKLRDRKEYDKVWKLVRESIRASEFKLSKADTISGAEEAEWAWIAANYLKHTLKGNDTFGTIDFGSSSLQLTYELFSNPNTSSNVKKIVIAGRPKTIYEHSYLCYGQHEMGRRFLAKLVKEANYTSIVANPCDRKGYNRSVTSEFLWSVPCSSGDYAKNYLGEEMLGPMGKTYTIHGSFDYDKCYKDVKHLLDRNCTKGTCGMNNEFQPAIRPGALGPNFLGLSTLYYLWKDLPLGDKRNPYILKGTLKTAVRDLCEKRWDPSTTDKYLADRCFQGVYSYYMLIDGFKFSDTAKTTFTQKIDGHKIGWSFGLIYTNKDNMYTRIVHHIKTVTTPGFIALLVIGILILLIGLGGVLKYWKRKTEVDSEA